MRQLSVRKTIASALALGAASLMGCEPGPLPDDATYEPSVAVPVCQSNNDGIIERSELPFAVGVKARYRVAEGEIAVDTKGTIADGGPRVWDFSRPDPGEEPVAQLGAEYIEGMWFEESFPQVELVGPLTPGADILGPMRIDDDGVHLYGLASAAEDAPSGKTLAVYDEPVTLYPFPLSLGARIERTATATGAVLVGLPTAFNDTYDVEVTQIGTMRLPDLILDNTLRVTVRFERTLLAGDVKQISHIYMHECLGEVARVISPAVAIDEELDEDFEYAAELRRLSL